MFPEIRRMMLYRPRKCSQRSLNIRMQGRKDVGNGNRFYRSNYLTDRAFAHDLRAMRGKGVDVRVVYDDGTESGRQAPRKKE